MGLKFDKFLWKIKNFPIQINFFFKIFFNRVPSWKDAERNLENYWSLFLKEDFDELNEEKWHIHSPPYDWGTARPDNICVYVRENVICKNSILRIESKKQRAKGKGWEGEPIERDYTSGSIYSLYDLQVGMKPGQERLFRAKIRSKRAYGSWSAYWLFKHTGPETRYSELDGYEEFPNHKINKNRTWSHTVHWGPSGKERYMFVRNIKFNSDDWMIFDIIVKHDLVQMRINGVTTYISGLGVPYEEDVMRVLFNDCVAVPYKLDDRKYGLPYWYEVDYFKVYDKV